MPVFIWTCDYPVPIALELEEIRLKLGAGIEKVIEKSVAVNRQDGTGSASSFNGAFVWDVTCTKRRSIDADALWDFLRARESDKLQFTFYDPGVTAPPDPTEVTVAGKHTVVLRGRVTRTLVQLDEYQFQFQLAEDLS